MTAASKILISLIIGTLAGFGDLSFAKPKPRPLRGESLVTKAQEQYAKKRYRRAISLYRKYLRKNRRDADVWSQLAVTYLYAGQPQKALRFLRKWHRKTSLKAYNEYHQGLAYMAIGYYDKSKIALTRAARFNDEFAGRATFELLVIEYNDRRIERTQYWINLYKQRYPQGAYIRDVLRIEQSLRNGSFIEGLTGNPKPDVEEAMFKYHRLSLYPKPHYWFVRTGYDYTFGVQTDPSQDRDNPIKENPISDHKLMVHSGVGLGPIQKNGATSWFGYNYKQDWITDNSRLNLWYEEIVPSGDVLDMFVYFPFRADLLERTHELYGEVRYPFMENLFFGLFGRQDFKFIGSELIPGADQLEIEQKRASISDSTTLIPTLGINYYRNYQTLLFLYLRKEINREAPEFSNQSYNIFGGGEPGVSLGLSHRMSFPEYKFNVAAEVYRYEYIFNDYWLDYTRTGFLLGMEYQFIRGFWVNANLGLYTDEYSIPVLRQQSCDFAEKGEEPAVDPENCNRTDDGTMLSVGAFWDYSQFFRVAIEYRLVENANPTLKVYERTEESIIATMTWAFPSNQRILRFLDRFGDRALTKEPGE